jgi:hypothetical protein
MRKNRHSRKNSNGSALIEIAISYATLVIVALLVFKASVNATATQNWTIKQGMSDAYITQETSLASRVPFESITGAAALWPAAPEKTTTVVTIGKLPGGIPVTATLYRTRTSDANNLPSAGGSGTVATNPSESEAWKLQSILVYSVGDKQYVKSRNTLRTR